MGKTVMRTMQCAALSALALLPLLAGAGQITHTANYGGRVTLGTDTLGGTVYTTVRYGRLHSAGEAGAPSLPVDYIRFSVPWNATGFTVSATGVTGETLLLDHPVYPSQSGAAVPALQPSRAASAHPASLAWYVSEGMFAGENHIVTVAVSPVTYRHGTGDTLSVLQSVTLTLGYELSDTPPMTPLVRRDTTLRNKGFALARSIVANPGDVKGNAILQHELLKLGYPPAPNRYVDTDATYLIVTTDELKHSMRRLAALKKQKGINVKVVTMDEVLNDPLSGNGDYIPAYGYVTYNDDAGKLRQYLRMHFNNYGTEYVLLAGSDVPYRGNSEDMYFGELNSNWPLTGRIMDTSAELYVGRLLGSDPQKFDNYTDKLFRYELNPGNGDHSYLRRALFTESSYWSSHHEYMEELIGVICPDTTSILGSTGLGYPSGCDVLDSIGNRHYGFIAAFNEGTPSYLKVCGYGQSSNSKYLWALENQRTASGVTDAETGNGFDLMDNREYPAIFFEPLAYNTLSYDCQHNNVDVINCGESFTMGKNYGGPVYLGMATTVDINGQGIGLPDAELFSGEFGGEIALANPVLGEAYAYAKSTLNGYCRDDYLRSHNYLGDPSLDMWTDEPLQYSNITVTRTDHSVSISGLHSTASALAYHSNDGTVGLNTVLGSSATLIGVSPNSTLMVYRHNSIPYIAPLVLQNTDLENSQYVIASDVIAGKSVDSGRTTGEVTVKDGAEYEIEASGTVTLDGGFKVEKGAKFAVYKSSYK